MSTENDLKTLRVPGLRVTIQRSLIIDIIRRERGHLDADDIYRRAKKKRPHLSLSTVYRTLQALKKIDLIEEVHFDEGHHYYEVKSSTEHQHLICVTCGRVVEFKYPLSQEIQEYVKHEKGFEVTEVDVQMKGYCPKCQYQRD